MGHASEMVGYSGTPLARKLGIKEGARVALLAAPEGFDAELAPLPAGVTVLRRLAPDLDVAVLFVTERRQLERRFEAIARAVFPAGGFWVAWPKRASKVPTDLTEDVLRDVALPKGLVDNQGVRRHRCLVRPPPGLAQGEPMSGCLRA
jgi:hypothetical protein